MDELYELFNQLSETQRKLVLDTPTLLDAFCIEASNTIGVDIDILKTHMMKLDAYAKGEVERVVKLSNSVERLKDKSLRLIERQTERELWYNEMVIKPLTEALAVKGLLDDGNTFQEALEALQGEGGSGLLTQAQKRIERANDLSSIVQRPRLIRWDDGSSRMEREKKATLYHEILNIMKTEGGIGFTKTQLLRRVKKDNSSWRAVCEEVLGYMESRELIIRQNRKYFYAVNYHSREQGYHRVIYELIISHPQSKTSILKKMGYNNTKGRTKLAKALNQLMVEGLITTDGIKWSRV